MESSIELHIEMWQMGILLAVGGLVFLLLIILVVSLYRKLANDRERFEKLLAERTAALETEITILQTAFDSMPAIMFCKDREFRLLRVNNTFERMFNLPREKMLGRTEREILDMPDDVTTDWNALDRKVMDERNPFSLEETFPVPGLGVRVHETTKVPLIVDGNVIGLLGMSRDITQRKEMEQQILAASNAKTAFIANMSHEIRTPMNSIIGFSELALEEEMSLKSQTYLHRIIESSNWLLQIINDILDISKIESGKLELENTPFNIADIFSSCQTMSQPIAIEKGLTLHFYTESLPDNKWLMGDPVRLRQIFTNLVTNAMKFTHEGIIRVSASVENSTETTYTIRCEIQDSGIGMTQEQIEKISEPFMQADVSITRKYGGTGLGVPIVSKLVELMGGKLEIESSLGEGSVFSFQLTFDATDAPKNIEGVNLNLGKPKFNGLVLVCEDNKMNQMVISDHLSRVGLTAVVAANGQIGVNLVKERMRNPFDLILMDVHMPVMDGLEATQQIMELGCPTPIVALTANVMTTDRESYKQYGMIDCIGKPFTSSELWNCLIKYIKPTGWGTEDIKDEQDLTGKLNESFVRDNKEKFREIMNSVKNGDLELTHRLVHTLKSSAGFIGEKNLQLAASETEDLLRDGSEITNERWRLLGYELDSVLAKLIPQVKQKTVSANKTPQDAQSLFNRLEPLLRNRSPECLEFLNEIREISGAEELARHVESYDFKPAMQVLLQLKETWRGNI